MATGDKYLSISENRLLGWQSLKNLFFDYLDKQSRTMAERVYATGSTFGTETALVADGVDQIKLTGYPPDSVSAVDGLGRFLDFRQRTSDVEDIHFENTLGTEYEVSVQQAPLPGGVFVNPADGMPAWNYYEDIVGFLGTPDLVTDNLDGTITFEVDSITESGHNNHGRQVYVYKNTITKSALTDQLAKQLCTTVYTGGKNKITTTLVGAGGAGTFGQVTVSTTPSHYTVILVGPRVGVDLDLRESTSACFLGTVTGAGLGNAPTVFAMAAQNVFDFDLTLLSDITRLEPASGTDRLKVDVKVIPGDAATDQIRVTNGALSPITRFKVDGAGLVTTEDSLLVKGGMVVGYDAVPTADKISIGDALFNIDYNSGNPKIQFATPASGGVLVYRRTEKDLTWKMQNVDEVVLAQGPVLKLGDAMFNLDYSAGYPRLQFGNDDYFKFDRTIDTLTWNSNGVLGCFGYADTPGFFVGATSFSLKYNAAGNQVIFDTLDYIEYAKAGDYWMYFINNTEFLRMVVNKLVPINATFALGDTTHFFLTAYITEQFTSILRPPAGKSPYQIDMYGDVVAGSTNTLGVTGTRWSNGFFSTVTASTIKSTSLTIRSEADGDVNVFIRGAIYPVTAQVLNIGSATAGERIDNGHFDILKAYLGLSVVDDKVASNLIPDVATRTLGRTGLRWEGFFGNLTATTGALTTGNITTANIGTLANSGSAISLSGHLLPTGAFDLGGPSNYFSTAYITTLNVTTLSISSFSSAYVTASTKLTASAQKNFGYHTSEGIFDVLGQATCDTWFGAVNGHFGVWNSSGSDGYLCVRIAGTWRAVSLNLTP